MTAPRSLLVVRLSALGDVIHTVPAVVALRDALPETKISWAVEAPYRDIVELVARVQPIPVRMKKWSASPLRFAPEIRRALAAMRAADVAVDFQGLMKSSILAFASGAKRRIGFTREVIREKPALILTNENVGVDASRHVIEQNLQLASHLLPSPLPAAPAADWSSFPAAAALDPFAGAIVLLPGAGKANKQWPIDRYRELAARLGSRALAVWGPGERELAEATGARVAPPTTLRELAWLLARAAVVIGGDTGPLHMAAALGVPVVGLYGPTDPRRTGPYGQLEHCVDHYRTTKLIDSITVEEAMRMISKVIA